MTWKQALSLCRFWFVYRTWFYNSKRRERIWPLPLIFIAILIHLSFTAWNYWCGSAYNDALSRRLSACIVNCNHQLKINYNVHVYCLYFHYMGSPFKRSISSLRTTRHTVHVSHMLSWSILHLYVWLWQINWLIDWLRLKVEIIHVQGFSIRHTCSPVP